MGLTGGSGDPDHPGTARFAFPGRHGGQSHARSSARMPAQGQGVFEAGSAALNNANVFISKLQYVAR